ncbi:MAG: polymerase sigma factor, sigma-70 family [Gemmatimonadetes bacterium]|nr:polymerase sigma factor, sigma-70 family [Gemmatimonadota bacterium]
MEMTDAMLVRDALEGDPSAFAMLVDRHAPRCLRYATRMLGSLQDAEEVTQETLLRVHRNLATYDPQMSFSTWMMSILVNRCRSALLQQRRRSARVVLDEDAVKLAFVPSTAGDVELRDAIERAVAQLDEAQREAFLLKHVEMLSYDDIAAVTGAGVSALKMRVQRACERLQVLLHEDRYA